MEIFAENHVPVYNMSDAGSSPDWLVLFWILLVSVQFSLSLGPS